MAEPQLGANVVVFANQQRLGTLQSAEKMVDGQKVAIVTFDGVIAYTQGPGKTTIDLTLALTKAGEEFPFDAFATSMEYLTLQFGAGPKSYAAKGQVLTAKKGKSSPTGEATLVISWEGPISPEE